ARPRGHEYQDRHGEVVPAPDGSQASGRWPGNRWPSALIALGETAMKVEFYRHNVDEDDIAHLVEVCRGVFLTTGQDVKQFEEAFAAYLGARHAVGVTSCTAALHLALVALGVGPGDEVITTAMTLAATSNAVLYTGATPVFADVEDATGLIRTDAVERAITPRTKAILPVHLYGQMADMRQLKTIADGAGVAL